MRGRLGALGEALAGLLGATGVRTGVEVGAVGADEARVTGVDLAVGGHLPADAVVANVDAAHLYRGLPLVAMSGAIVAGLVAEALAAGRLGRRRAVAP